MSVFKLKLALGTIIGLSVAYCFGVLFWLAFS